MTEWISCEDRMPAAEHEVLAIVNGKVRIAALFWEHPSYEDTFQSFLYWDDPDNDGQCWEHHHVSHWMEMPEVPDARNDA